MELRPSACFLPTRSLHPAPFPTPLPFPLHCAPMTPYSTRRRLTSLAIWLPALTSAKKKRPKTQALCRQQRQPIPRPCSLSTALTPFSRSADRASDKLPQLRPQAPWKRLMRIGGSSWKGRRKEWVGTPVRCCRTTSQRSCDASRTTKLRVCHPPHLLDLPARGVPRGSPPSRNATCSGLGPPFPAFGLRRALCCSLRGGGTAARVARRRLRVERGQEGAGARAAGG